MTRVVGVFFILLIIGVVDYYVFQSIAFAFSTSSAFVQSVVSIIFWTFTGIIVVLILLYFFSNTDQWPIKLKSYLLVGIIGNIISKFAIMILAIFGDIFQGFQHIMDAWAGNNAATESSKHLIWSQISTAIGAVPPLAMSWGIISGAHDYRIRKVQVTLPHLPKAFDGITLGQLSDIHAGSFHNRVAVKGGVELLNEQQADVVFFTGDLVNNQAGEMNDYVSVFDKVKAPLGVYSIFGNHDYGDYIRWPSLASKQGNINNLIKVHENLGWNLLLNERRFIEQGGEKLAIIGIENWGARGFSKYGKMNEAHQGTDEAEVKLLLSHDPSHWSAEVLRDYSDIDVMFAGHTHGMQFGVEIGGFKWSPVQYMYKEWAGLYEKMGQYLYVNRGFGYLAYPGRIGIPPEITIMELRRG